MKLVAASALFWLSISGSARGAVLHVVGDEDRSRAEAGRRRGVDHQAHVGAGAEPDRQLAFAPELVEAQRVAVERQCGVEVLRGQVHELELHNPIMPE